MEANSNSNNFENAGEDDKDLFDNFERILDNDTALNMVSSKFEGMTNDKIRNIAKPLLKIMKSRGVEMFSAGDDNRAAKIKNGVETMNSYAAIFIEFLPILKSIYDYIKENNSVKDKLHDDDWDSMMLEEEQVASPQNPNVRVDPNNIRPPPQQQQPRTYSGNANVAPNNQPVLTWRTLLEKHMNKYGSTGMDKVVKDVENMGQFSLGMQVRKDNPLQQNIGGPSPISSLQGLTMKDIAQRHQAKFGSDGMGKVLEEMNLAKLDTNGINIGNAPQHPQAPQQQQPQSQQQYQPPQPVPQYQYRDTRYDDEEEVQVAPQPQQASDDYFDVQPQQPAERYSSTPAMPVPPLNLVDSAEGVDEGFKRNCNSIRSRLSDMPRQTANQFGDVD